MKVDERSGVAKNLSMISSLKMRVRVRNCRVGGVIQGSVRSMIALSRQYTLARLTLPSTTNRYSDVVSVIGGLSLN